MPACAKSMARRSTSVLITRGRPAGVSAAGATARL